MNKLTNIAKFIEAWDTQIAELSIITKNDFFKKSDLENINYAGDCSSDAAATFTQYDSLFYAAIEEGVRDLVMVLVKQCEWITFSSCAGHVGFKSQAYKKRMVQLLPRNEAQLKLINFILSTAADKTNVELMAIGNPIIVMIYEEKLLSEEKNFASIKLIFNSHALDEQAYFANIDAATDIFSKNLIYIFKGSHG